MGKLGGLAVVSLFALTGCASQSGMESAASVERVPVVASQEALLDDLRPLLRTLDSSDTELLREAYVACGNLSFRDKDSYREAILKQYESDLQLGLDHLTVAAAAQMHICPKR